MPAASHGATTTLDTDTGARSKRTLGHLTHLGIVAGLFLASRIAMAASGVYFRGEVKGDQLLDAKQLAADPFLAFTSNNIQPPLWNFFVGGVLRWSPFPPGISFQLLFVATSLVTVLCLWELLRGIGARRWVATVATTLVGFSPLMILNDRILHYEAFETTVLTVSALTFLRYVRQPSRWRLAVFGSVIVVGVLTRTTLHPLWFVGALVIALLCRPPRGWWPSAAGVVAVLVLLIAIPMAHRAVAYDTVGFSSFWGANLRRITTMQLPEHELRRLIRNGTLSPISQSLGPYRDYAKYLPPCKSATGRPVLDDIRKSDGDSNFNARCMLPVYEAQEKDAFASIRADPGSYISAVGRSAIIYVSWPGVKRNYGLLKSFDAAYAPLALRIRITTPERSDPQLATAANTVPYHRVSITIIIALLLSLWLGLRGIWRFVRGRAATLDFVRIFIGFTVASVTAVGVTMDTFENARFREPLDPLLLGPLFVLVLEFVAVRVTRFREQRVARLGTGSSSDHRDGASA